MLCAPGKVARRTWNLETLRLNNKLNALPFAQLQFYISFEHQVAGDWQAIRFPRFPKEKGKGKTEYSVESMGETQPSKHVRLHLLRLLQLINDFQ